MHLRKLTFTVGLVGAMCSSWAYGLGLGEITLNSTLNQPLDAEIKLLQVRNLSAEEIFVELASSGDFQRFGVDRIFFLQNLDFDVQLDHPDGPVVRVTTDEPVREPYLIFLLEAQSPGGGRLLREYTLLMDLPVFADEEADAVEGVQTRPEPQQAQTSPAPAAAEAAPVRPRAGEPPRAEPAPRPQPAAAQDGVDVYGPVQANDTLWEIAARVRPGSDVSVQQTMIALQRANPDAFINGNINLLKRGQVLRVPERSEFEALDQNSAINEVAVHNEQWNAIRNGEVTGAELQASSSRPASTTPSQSRRGQLTLAAPGDVNGAGEQSGAGDSSANTQALENELAVTSEELDASRRENQELSERVSELEEQIATMERLLEVSSEELRAMQLATEERNQAAAEAQNDASTADSAAAAELAAVEPETAVQDSAESSEATGAAAEPEAAEANTPVAQPERTVVPSRPAPEPSIVDLLMANLWYLLVAVLTILGAVVYLLHRRSQKAEMEAFEQADEQFFAEDDAPLDIESADLNEESDFADPLAMESDSDAETEQDIAETQPVEAETEDAVGEADIYIAYGKYAQAEEMLQRAILTEPNNTDARLKLLEVYSETKDLDKFDREYAQLQDLGDSGARARADDLRSVIPGAAESAAPTESDAASGDFGGSDEFAAGSFEFDGGDDFDESFELDDQGATSPGDTPAADDDFGDLTFDLDEDVSGDDLAAASQNESTASEDESDEGFDFELDLDDELETGEQSEGEAEAPVAATELADDEREEPLEFDLSDELSLDAEGESSERSRLAATDDFDFDPDASSESLADSGEFDLQMDSHELGSNAGADDASGTLAEDDFDLTLDLDGDDSGAKSDAPADSAGDSEDIFSDLEFSSGATEEAGSEPGDASSEAEEDFSFDELESELDALGAESLNIDDLDGPDADAGSAEASQADADKPAAAESSEQRDGEADDFDMDMGELDLEALDQEMDALVGGVDDLDDDVAVATPTDTSLETAREVATESRSTESAADEFDLDSFAASQFDGDKQASPEIDVPSFGEDLDAEEGVDEDLDSELDFLADTDEVATKLDLARAYIDMGDRDGARDILDEVNSEGNEEQKKEAAELLGKIV